MKNLSDFKLFNQYADLFIKQAEDMMDYCSDIEIAEALGDTALPMLPRGQYKTKVLVRLIERNRERKQKAMDGALQVPFFIEEVELMKSIEDINTRKLLYALLIQRKLNPHDSGYIKLDSDNTIARVFDYSGYKKIGSKNYLDLISHGLDLRVIGAKNPMICFKLYDIPTDGIVSFICDIDNAKECFERYLSNARN